jgi:FtsP/CotA-like multicopper oxidase with cupredoxin domain
MRSFLLAALALTAASSLQAQTSPAVPAVDYSTATPADGNWTYAPLTGGSQATFANTAAQPQLTVTCARASRQVTIAKAATGAAPFLVVWTSTQSRNLPASYNPATGLLSAFVSATDPTLDAIAFSRGRAAFGASGQATLIVPTWAEVARVIEDCRA